MSRHLSSLHEESLDTSVIPARVAAACPQFRLSTYQPTNADVARIQDILEKEEKSLQKYDEEVEDLEQKLRQVKAGRSVVEDNISTCLSALSVCRRLPVEIWEFIFSRYVSLYAYSFIVDDHNSTHEIIKMPTVTISRVCQSWRSIVRGCPALWSTIDLALVGQLDREVRGGLKLHLENSKEHPLQVRLQNKELSYYRGRYGSTTQRAGRDSWQLLCSHMNRWQTLTLGGGCSHLPQVNNPSLPNLTSLVIESSYSRHSNSPYLITPHRDWLSQVLHNSVTPRLEFIELTDLDQVDEIPSCSRLTKLHVRDLRVNLRHRDRTLFPLNLLHILEASNNLRSLSLTVNFDDRNELCTRRLSASLGSRFRSSVDVQLPLLESLTIHDRTSYGGRDTISPLQALFCSSIAVASLADLELVCRSRSVPIYFDMITRSTPPLTSLRLGIKSIQDIHPSRLPVLSFWESFSSTLARLELDVTTDRNATGKYREVVDPFVGDILSKLKVSTFLPMLSSITLGIQDISVTNEIIDAALEIALQRQAAAVPLRSFCLIRLTCQWAGGLPRKLVATPQEVIDRINELRRTFGIRVEFEERHCGNDQETLRSHAQEEVFYSDVIEISDSDDDDVELGIGF
ncbi:hypothetical protein PM082_007073 [Marasmius tenuissimus]|nr:hypothetical protein PM082_007073 [Marasmius tenuissimus]